MDEIVWVVSKNPALCKCVARLLGRETTVIDALADRASNPAVPGLILVACDYRCRFEECAGNFRLALRFPDTQAWLIRSPLNCTMGRSSPPFLASYLGQVSDACPEVHKKILARLANPFGPDTGLEQLASTIARLQHRIMVAHGKIGSVSELAHAVYRSESWLSKHFKQMTGMTLVDFIRRVRFCHCLWELCASNKPINLVASEHGRSPAYLSRGFHTVFGLWPSDVRRAATPQRTHFV